MMINVEQNTFVQIKDKTRNKLCGIQNAIHFVFGNVIVEKSC